MKLKKSLFCLLAALTVATIGVTPVLAEQPATSIATQYNNVREGLGELQSLAIIPAPQEYFVVNANNVQYRRTPGLSGEVIGQVHKGTVVGDLSTSKTVDGMSWNQVQYNGLNVWIASQYLDWAG